MHFGFDGFGMIFGWLVIIAVIVILVKLWTDSTRNRDTRSKTPMQILEERYAAGEIGRDEFEEKKRDLVQR